MTASKTPHLGQRVQQVYSKLPRRKGNQTPSRCTPCPQGKCRRTSRQDGKYHLIAALATLDWGCPIQLWSKMLKQVQDTLNMFRTSRNDTTKTAYQELEGEFDLNATPIWRHWAPKAVSTSTLTTATRSRCTVTKDSPLAAHHTTTVYSDSTSHPPEDTASTQHTTFIPNTAACLR